MPENSKPVQANTTDFEPLTVPSVEHDACGTGYVIGKNALPYALNILVKNDHRIGHNPSRPKDTVPEIGDGAGVVTEIPRELLARDIPALSKLTQDDYGVARIYLPGTSTGARKEAMKIVTENLAKSGFTEIGRRKVEGELSILAESIQPAHDHIYDIAFARPKRMTDEAYHKAMFDCQMNMERELEQHKLSACHIGAISDRITVYKGIFNAEQLGEFFKDFHKQKEDDPEFNTRFAFYHGRFATNAATRLPNVHPFIKGTVALGHNGEIVTIKGNRERLEREIRSETGTDFTIPQGITDSHTLSYALAFLCDNKKIDAAEAMKHLVSAGWRNDPRLNDETKNTLEAMGAGGAPYAGPAYIGFVDTAGKDIKINSIMDFAGLRPCNIMTLKDGTVITGSENALPDGVPMDQIASIRSLKPLEQVQFDVATGKMTENSELLDRIVGNNRAATQRFQDRLVQFAPPAAVKGNEEAVLAEANGLTLSQRRFALGHDKQTQDYFAEGMAKTGMPPVGAMGKVTPAWYLTDVPAGLSRASKAAFSIVTAPPHDAKREGYLMDMTTYLGDVRSARKSAKIIRLPSAILPYGGLEALNAQMDKSGIKHKSLDCTFDTTEDFGAFKARLVQLEKDAVDEANKGAKVIVLSDMNLSDKRQAIDNMLIAALVHKALDKAGKRDQVSLVFESGSARTEHDAFMLLTNGMDAIYTPMHYAGIVQAVAKGALKPDDLAQMKEEPYKSMSADEKKAHLLPMALENAQKGMVMGVINAISRCGIPSLSAARDAQLFTFEGVRVTPDEPELWRAFGGNNPVYSPLGVYGLEKVWENAKTLHEEARRIQGTDLPDFKTFFQQGDRRYPLADTSSMKQWADEMVTFRQHFAMLERISPENLGTVQTEGVKDLAAVKAQITGALESELRDEQQKKVDTQRKKLEDAQRDGKDQEAAQAQKILGTLEARLGQPVEIPKPAAEAVSKLTADEIQMYANWRALRDGAPSITVQQEKAGGHNERLVQIGEAPKNAPDPLAEKQLPLLNGATVNKFHLRPSMRLAFDAMADFEHENPRGLMDMLSIKPGVLKDKPVGKPIPADEIAKHLYIASMSMGALTPSANRLLSQVANSVGINKETGEGGMSARDQNLGDRENDHAQDKVVQIGSGRFGATTDFLISPDRWVEGRYVPGSVTIKMAQGAKPGEGGQIPGSKVTPLIAALRNAFPGVDLPSPAPHHDIYSIEDLYQLVRDCKRTAVKGVERPVGVKIASSGPDVFAVGVGVAKMGADYIIYAAGDGGTGAGPLTSIQHAGRSMEDAILLARKLDDAGFVNTPKRYYEGGIKTPLDFVRATCAGYDCVGFGSAAVIAEGCIWLQQCNVQKEGKVPGTWQGACRPGVANNEEKFDVDPKTTQEYFLSFMHGVSDILSKMKVDGQPVKSLDQIRGRTDLLECLVPDRLKEKNANWNDMNRLLKVPRTLPHPDPNFVKKPNPAEQSGYQLEDWMMGRVHDLAIESKTLKDHAQELKSNWKVGDGRKLYDWTMEKKGNVTVVSGSTPIDSTQFIGPGVGAFVAAVNGYLRANPDSKPEDVIRRLEIGELLDKKLPNAPSMWSKRGREGKPAPSLELNLKLKGHGAQSFGALTPEGVNYDVEGALQYGAFKMTSGGEHTIRSPLGREGMAAGNSFGYGARGGFFAIEGNLGPRAGVRNAGASYVIDGDVGDNSFTFMSRGSVVLLGDPGINFGAGSSAGVMAVYDREGAAHLKTRCHAKSVGVHSLSAPSNAGVEQAIWQMLKQHVDMIEKSAGENHQSRARDILDHWETEKKNFYIVEPKFLEKAVQKLGGAGPEVEQYRKDVVSAYTPTDGRSGPQVSPIEMALLGKLCGFSSGLSRAG